LIFVITMQIQHWAAGRMRVKDIDWIIMID
jgi:hypothetical protein